MRISLDYDNTYSCDPELWKQFVAQAQARGHQFWCVTGRYDGQLTAADLPPGVQIIFCNHKLKREEAKRQGVEIDVWIDDTPEGIGESRGSS